MQNDKYNTKVFRLIGKVWILVVPLWGSVQNGVLSKDSEVSSTIHMSIVSPYLWRTAGTTWPLQRCAITRHTHSLRSCHLPSIMTLFQYVSLASFSPYLSVFFSFFKKALSQGRRHVHLTLDISLSSRVYTFILIERLQIACYRPHDTWSSKLIFFRC